MNLKKHIMDTIKEWQLKIGYREGNMKLYYPGESLAELLGITNAAGVEDAEQSVRCNLQEALKQFCEEVEPQLGRIQVSGSDARFCLDVPAKGCAYVAGKVPEPEFLKLFLEQLTKPGNTMEQIRECFESYGKQRGTHYMEECGHAFYFADEEVEEYVYWVEENEFGLTYHRFTREEFHNMK